MERAADKLPGIFADWEIAHERILRGEGKSITTPTKRTQNPTERIEAKKGNKGRAELILMTREERVETNPEKEND